MSNPGPHFKCRVLPEFQGKWVHAFLLASVCFPDDIFYVFGKLKIKFISSVNWIFLNFSTLETQEGQEYGWILKGLYICSSFWSTEEKIHTVNKYVHISMCVYAESSSSSSSSVTQDHIMIFSVAISSLFYNILSLLYK